MIFLMARFVRHMSLVYQKMPDASGFGIFPDDHVSAGLGNADKLRKGISVNMLFIKESGNVPSGSIPDAKRQLTAPHD